MNISAEELQEYCQTEGVMLHLNSQAEYNEMTKFVIKNFPERRSILDTYDEFAAHFRYLVFANLPNVGYCDDKGIEYRQEHGFKDTILKWEEFKTQFDVTPEDMTVYRTVDEKNVYKYIYDMPLSEKIKAVEQYFLSQGFCVINTSQCQ